MTSAPLRSDASHVPEDVLDAAFPFHLLLDRELRVVAVGRSLGRLCPGIAPGDDVGAHLSLRTGAPLTTRTLESGPRSVLVLTAPASGVLLRGQALPVGDDGLVALLITPWLTEPDELTRTGLVLDDFAPHDSTPDFMFLSQAQATALEDARRLAERLRALEAQRRHQALRDPLTGVGNRREFAEQLERAAPGTALVLIDVDDFKAVNDTFGNAMGDAVLRAVTQRLETLVDRGRDRVTRIGGDEFAVLICGEDGVHRSRQVAEGIVEAMREPVVLGSRRVSVTISVGVVPDGDPEALSRNGDVALYSAKRGGRGRIVVFDAVLHESLLYRAELRDRLGGALGNGAISVVYQPIVQLSSGQVHGFEALARWTDPMLGPIPPDAFIAIAEEAGLIAELGLFVLATGARQLGEWRRRFPAADLLMSVNLAPRQLEDPDLVTHVRDVLTTNLLPASSLQLELTESAFTSDQRSTEQLHRLRDLGVPLAIDDFGSSESTLARLHKIPATVLKIDRAFLTDLEVAPERSARLLQAVVAIADALELSTVAEGIETPRHRDVVMQAGCTFGQGWLYARPLDAEHALEYLEQHVNPAVPRPRQAEPATTTTANTTAATTEPLRP